MQYIFNKKQMVTHKNQEQCRVFKFIWPSQCCREKFQKMLVEKVRNFKKANT